jgi:hypothetical protein
VPSYANSFHWQFTVLIFCAVIAAGFYPTLASAGTINPTYKYAWGENIGWVNFGATNGNVQVTDSGLTGYAWSQNYGWINLNPTNSGVKNDGNGNLSGYAWGQQLGYINFSGVVINSSGVFTGQAYGTVSGRISFDCTNCRVMTDYRPGGVAASITPPSGGGGGTGYYLPLTPVGTTTVPTVPAISSLVAQQISASIGGIIGEITKILNALIPSGRAPAPPQVVQIPRVAPLALQGGWDLLSPAALGNFVLAPLPKEIALLTEKFPQLKQTLKEVGVSGAVSLPKLQGVELTLPGLGESSGLPQREELVPPGMEKGGKIVQPELTAGKLGLPLGIPLVELTPQFKRGIPTEIVFARSSDEKIDLDIKLSLNRQGKLEKRINAVAGTVLKLVVKPGAAVDSVKGYLVLRSRSRPAGISEDERALSLRAALASLVFQTPDLAQSISKETAADIEERLALMAFEYTDPDGDGIYTADVQVPKVDGQYDIITLISYKDPDLGVRQIGLTAVVDPEGYVYEKIGDKELRIPNATVSLYLENPATGIYELWPAKQYSQENPQITDVRGVYAFLVPRGSYYITVTAPDYRQYTGSSFDVEMGNEIHFNIELHPSGFWASWDWKTALLILVGALLLANFYWDKRRERSLTP